jgi:Tfp pilus assembly protein PilF
VNGLSELPGVRVRSPRTIVDPSTSDSVKKLAEGTNLDMMLMGTLAQSGDQYLLQLELVRGSDAIHLASFQYSGSRQELTSISKRIQSDFFGFLKPRNRTSQRIQGSTEDRAAYSSYLQGKYYSNEASPESLAKAIANYQDALARDPEFALAYSGMAVSYVGMSNFSASPNQSLDKAKQLAQQALARNPSLAEAHAVLGFAIFLRDWNFIEGEKHLRTAIHLDPDQAPYYNLLSVILSDEGRFDESLHEIDLAHAAAPSWDGAYETETYLAGNARRQNRMLQSAQRYVSLRPHWPPSHDSLAWALFATGRYEEAIREWRLMAEMEQDKDRVRLEDRGLAVLRSGGIHAYAQVRLAAAVSAQKAEAHRNDFVLAEWYARAGERDQALAALQRLVADHDPLALEIAVNPMYENLHQDRRYLALLTSVGVSLPQLHNHGE